MKFLCLPLLKNTFQRELRSKTLMALLVLTLGSLIFTHFVLGYFFKEVMDPSATQMVGDQSVRIFYFFIYVWSIFLSVYLGTGTLKTDETFGVQSQLLALPMTRAQYLFTRWIGSGLIVFGYNLLSYLLAILLLSFDSKGLPGGWGPLAALGFNFLGSMSMVLISMVVSLWTSRTMGFILSFLFYWVVVSSNSYFDHLDFSKWFDITSAFKFVGVIIHVLVPHVGSLGDLTLQSLGESSLRENWWHAPVHFCVSAFVLFQIGHWVFHRRDLNDS